MFILTIMIILTIFAVDITLTLLNYNHRHKPIPQSVADIYDREAYEKWLKYTVEGFRLSMISKVVNTIILLCFLVFGLFNAIADFADRFSHNQVIQSLLFLAIYAVISYLLNIGFSIYRTFSIEERFGFNKTSVKTFITDQLKGGLLMTVLAGGLLYISMTLYLKLDNQALIYVWGIITGVSILLSFLYTKVFIKFFNKLTPLTSGELYDKTGELASNLGYEIKQIQVMDASKRSTKLNAFFSGFGRYKSVVLYDTLLETCTTEEIISILAHEIGHAKHHDVLKNMLVGMVQTALYLGLLGFFLSSDSFSAAFGFNETHLGFSIILFGILLEPIGLILGIPTSAMSRRAEYKADAAALKSGYSDAMVSSLKILARENFSNLTPHPLVVKMTYSHPPIAARIEALKK